MFLDGVLAVGCVPFLGTPDKGCDDPMVVVSTKEVIKEIVLNADAMIREQGASEDDPLDRMTFRPMSWIPTRTSSRRF